MDTPATIVWIAPTPPDATQARSLASWAQAHSRVLTSPRDEPPPALRGDPSIAEDVERWLDRAREAIAARDGEAVDASLGAAEAALRAHPELPQGAWLLADVERARSTRLRHVRAGDAEAAERAWMRAEALDGGRVAGIGEQASQAHPAAASLQVEVTPAGAQAWLDGAPVSSAVETRAGPHQLLATWRGTPIWGGWLETPPGASTVHLTAPEPPPCSSHDLSRVRMAPSTAFLDASGARCADWVAALPGDKPDEVRVAACEANHCGPLLSWRSAVTLPWSPPAERPRTTWPAWATWGLVGAGAAIATGVVVLATGALQPPPPETRFVSGGVKTQ
jgi:hypothetical protein